MVLGKLPVPGRPTIWMIVGQRPIALAVGAGGRLFRHFHSPLSFLSSFPLSLGDGLIKTEILSQRAVNPNTTNQPILLVLRVEFWLVGCFGLNGPLRQYLNLYRAVSQREGERKEK